MSNPSKQKGTTYETELLERLRQVWPDAERSPLRGVQDFGDFINVGPRLIEAKKRERWDLKGWIRGVLTKLKRYEREGWEWAIVFAGDRRSIPVDIVAMPLEQWLVLEEEIRSYQKYVTELESKLNRFWEE